MTRQPAPGHTPAHDQYAAKRCVHCGHIRYGNQEPGDPCEICDCADHVIPSEVPDAASS